MPQAAREYPIAGVAARVCWARPPLALKSYTGSSSLHRLFIPLWALVPSPARETGCQTSSHPRAQGLPAWQCSSCSDAARVIDSRRIGKEIWDVVEKNRQANPLPLPVSSLLPVCLRSTWSPLSSAAEPDGTSGASIGLNGETCVASRGVIDYTSDYTGAIPKAAVDDPFSMTGWANQDIKGWRWQLVNGYNSTVSGASNFAAHLLHALILTQPLLHVG